MTSPGWFAAIGCAVLLVLVNSAMWMVVSQADHGVGRNHLAGIRLPSLMKSEEAWRAGHVAARKVMSPFLIGAIAIALISIPLQLAPAIYVISIALSLIGTVLALGVGSAYASKSARHVNRRAGRLDA